MSVKDGLIDTRNRLLENPEVAAFVKQAARSGCTSWDFWISTGFLGVGILGFANLNPSSSLLTALGLLLLELAGIAGFSSLSHESWHRRALPSAQLNNWVSKWLISPLLLRGYEGPMAAHVYHHRFFGSEQDPDSFVWRQTKKEYRNAQLSRLLIFPAVLQAIKQTGSRGQKRNQPQRIDLIAILLVHSTWSALLLLNSVQAWLWGYCAALLLGAVLANVREYGEHAYTSGGKLIAYDTDCNLLQRLLISGGFFNLHALHHVFPELSQRHLPGLYEILRMQPKLSEAYYSTSPQVQKKRTYFEQPTSMLPLKRKAVQQCPLCGGTDRKFEFTGKEHEYKNTTDEEFDFFRCRRCSLVYMDSRPAEFDLPQIYPHNYYSHVANNASPEDLKLNSRIGKALHKRLLGRVGGNILPFMKLDESRSMLDVGCGGGRSLGSIHHEYGTQCVGIDFDIREDLLEKYQTGPITLRKGNFLEYDFGSEKFDVIYASHLIEHIDSPVRFLEKAGSVLKPGGLCVIETPNEDCFARKIFGKHWGGNHIPRHWFLLNPLTAIAASQKVSGTQFEVLAVRFSHNSAFWIWSLHSLLTDWFGRWISDFLFPADHRIVSTTPVNLVRHVVFTIVDSIILKVTGRTGNMSVIYRKV